jgi:hypothetical protein
MVEKAHVFEVYVSLAHESPIDSTLKVPATLREDVEKGEAKLHYSTSKRWSLESTRLPYKSSPINTTFNMLI